MTEIKFANDLCIDVPGGDTNKDLQIYKCNSTNSNQRFQYNNISKKIKHISSGKCIKGTAENKIGGIKLVNCDQDEELLNWEATDKDNGLKLNNGKCLDIGSGRENKGPVGVWGCNGGGNQNLTIPYAFNDAFDAVLPKAPVWKECDMTNNETGPLKADIDCKNATKCEINRIEHNAVISQYNSTVETIKSKAMTDYKTLQDRHNAKVSRWENKTGEYSNWGDKEKELMAEAKPWNNCVPWDQASGTSKSGWCEADHGKGWYHAGGLGGSCSFGFGKGRCKRNTENIKDTLNSLGYQADKPAPLARAPQFPGDVKSVPEGASINCCVNYIEAGRDVKENLQSCASSVDKKINTSSSIVVNDDAQSKESLDEPAEDKEVKEEEDNTFMIAMIALLLVFLVLLSASSSIAGLFFVK